MRRALTWGRGADLEGASSPFSQQNPRRVGADTALFLGAAGIKL